MYGICFALVLLMPLVMLAVGLKWRLKPPAYLTGKLVYRTAYTEKSPEVWTFAHVHFGKLWTRYGVILAVLCGAAMYVLRAKYQTYVLWLLCGQMLVLCVTIFMMELLIKNLYDENGQRIDQK